MKIQSILCCLLFALLLLGCEKANSSGGQWTTKDSWYHPATKTYDEPSHTLPDKEFLKVTASNFPRAEAMLKDQAIVPLSLKQAGNFVNHPLKQVPGKSTFLVRAVYLNAGTGAFLLNLQGNRLFVTHGSLGHHAVPMKRQALVVFLQKQPDEVFVDCMMAE